MQQRSFHSGFTLIELSIVLVIIALIVGGIIGGQIMIKNAEMRKLISFTDQVKIAMNAFKLKYDQLPGDMRDATSYWGSGSPGPSAVPSTTPPQIGTYNGNGDGRISPEVSPGIWAFQESGAAWQQLANAGLIPGMYSGYNLYAGDNNILNIAGVTNDAAPHSEGVSSAWWGIIWLSPASISYSATTGPWATTNALALTGPNPCYAGVTFGAEVLTITEMKSIEGKSDDGLPNSGKIVVPNSNASQGGGGCWGAPTYVTCITDSATSWSYNTYGPHQDYRACTPIFLMSN